MPVNTLAQIPIIVLTRIAVTYSLTQCSDMKHRTEYCDMITRFFHVLLTVHLSIFILVINQLDAQNFVLQ